MPLPQTKAKIILHPQKGHRPPFSVADTEATPPTAARFKAMNRDVLMSEIRYAERLCERTARLYRRIQAVATFLAIVGGSAAASALYSQTPTWVPIAGALILASFGAFGLAVRPADKAAQNEPDIRRYAALRLRAPTLTEEELRRAIDEASVGDAPEIESLRFVAYNDVAVETGRPDACVPLSLHQRLIGALA